MLLKNASKNFPATTMGFDILLSVLTVGLVVGFGTPVFSTNDDVFIRDFIREGWDVTFMSVVLGRFLSFFYLHVSPNLPWYGIALYLSHTVSLFLAFRLVNRVQTNDHQGWGFRAILAVCWLTMLLSIGYNDTGTMLCSMGLLLFLTAVEKKRITILQSVGYGLLITLGFAFRSNLLVLILVFLMPVVFWFSIRNINSIREFAALIITVTVLVLSMLLTERQTTSAEYKDFRAFNTIRGSLHDYPVLRENLDNQALLEANNWTKDDYQLFMNWIFVDETLYNPTTLGRILSMSDFKEDLLTRLPGLPVSFLRVLSSYGWSILLITILLIRIGWGTRVGTQLMIGTLGAYWLLGMIAMDLFLKFPVRIGIPLCITLTTTAVILQIFEEIRSKDTPQNTIKGIITLGLTMLVFLQGVGVLEQNQDNVTRRAQFEREVEFVNNTVGTGISYLTIGSTPARENASPLKDSVPKYIDLRTGWSTFSPRFYARLNQTLGIHRGADVFPSLAGRTDFFISGPDDRMERLKRFLQKHYGLQMTLELVGPLGKGKIYRAKLTSSPEANPPS